MYFTFQNQFLYLSIILLNNAITYSVVKAASTNSLSTSMSFKSFAGMNKIFFKILTFTEEYTVYTIDGHWWMCRSFRPYAYNIFNECYFTCITREVEIDTIIYDL